METYEKKYKDLVEAVKQLQKANPSDEGIQNWVNDNVPELAESEDEKIRKMLINSFTRADMGGEIYGKGVTYKQVIAWLEKQGEERKITHEEICKSYGIPDIGEFSDGYHTFNGLYKQRMILFAVLVKTYKDRAWKSWKHEDGLDCFGGGWFIVGIDTPAGTYTYHYEAKDWDRFDCQILEKAKHWDGHDEFDVERLFSLVSNAKKVPIWKHWKDGIAGNGEGKPIYLVKIGNTYSLTSCLGFECDYIELSELDNLMLVKQGEQNPYSGVSFSHNGNIWGMCARDNGVDILFNKKLIQHISGEKLANKVEPLDEFAGLTNFERTLADICIGWIGKEIGWKQYIKDNADVLLKIAVEKFNSVQDAPFEQKPAEWSEDYTERMGQIINYLTCQAKEEPTRRGTLLGWVALLKSIFRKGLPEIQIPCTEAVRKGIHRITDVLDWAADKGRISDSDCEDYMILLSAYLPQPKPTWSKEDKRMMDLIISVFEVNHPKGIFKDGLRAVHTDEIVSWLKSIEDRMKGE